MKNIYQLMMALAVMISPIHAESIVTDRPDFTESSQTAELGKPQLEMGYTFSESGDTQQHTLGEALIRIPLLSHLEARLGLNSIAFTKSDAGKTSGLLDSTIGFKGQVIPEQKGYIPQMAVIVDTTLPTGGNPYREDSLQVGYKICMGWDLSDEWSLSSNLNKAGKSISLGWGFAEKWGSYLEAFEDDSDSFMNIGITFLVSDNLQYDARIGKGLNGNDKEYFIGIGVSVR